MPSPRLWRLDMPLIIAAMISNTPYNMTCTMISAGHTGVHFVEVHMHIVSKIVIEIKVDALIHSWLVVAYAGHSVNVY